MSKKSRLIVLIFAAVLVASACDPAIHFSPDGWEKVGNKRFRKSFGSIEIEMDRVGGLIGETWLVPNFSIQNKGSEIVIFQKIVLVAGDEHYDSNTNNQAELTLRPNEVHELSTRWKFSEQNSLSQVFRKPPTEIQMETLRADQPTTIVIPLAEIRQ